MAGRHVEKQSSERTLALTILAVGTLVSLASLIGGVWLVRAGVVVAIMMAFAAVAVSWRELSALRERHAQEIRHEVKLRSEQASQHHTEMIGLIDRSNARAQNLQSVIAKLRSQVAAARGELSAMRGNAAWLRAEVAERQSRIEALQARIAELESQLAAADEEAATEDTGNVVALPSTVHPSVDDIWGDDEQPTVVNLQMLDLALLPELRKEA